MGTPCLPCYKVTRQHTTRVLSKRFDGTNFRISSEDPKFLRSRPRDSVQHLVTIFVPRKHHMLLPSSLFSYICGMQDGGQADFLLYHLKHIIYVCLQRPYTGSQSLHL